MGTGVDDPGLAKDVELLGRPLDRLLAGAGDHLEDRGEHPVLLLGRQVGVEVDVALGEPRQVHRRRVRHRPDDREHRSFRRVTNRLVGGVRRRGERRGDQQRIDQVAGPRRELLGGAADDLAEDHAGVATGPHQRRPGHGVDELGAVRLLALLGLDPVELGEHRAHRQRHVVAGVAVGDRIDVQVVDLVAAGVEVRIGGLDDPPEAGDRRIGGHGRIVVSESAEDRGQRTGSGRALSSVSERSERPVLCERAAQPRAA